MAVLAVVTLLAAAALVAVSMKLRKKPRPVAVVAPKLRKNRLAVRPVVLPGSRVLRLPWVTTLLAAKTTKFQVPRFRLAVRLPALLLLLLLSLKKPLKARTALLNSRPKKLPR